MALGAVCLVAIPWAALPMVLPAVVLLFADSTDAAVLGPAGILRRVLVTPQTAGLLTPVISASPKILQVRDWFHVRWVHAMARLAEMVKLQAIGNRANQVFVHQSMHGMGFLFPATAGIAFWRDCADPEPALVGLPVGYVFSE